MPIISEPPPVKRANSPSAGTRMQATPKVTREREEMVAQLGMFAQVPLMATKQLADAAAIGIYWPKIAKELAVLAETQEQVANFIDPLIKVGPFAGLIAAVIPLAMQIGVNHGGCGPAAWEQFRLSRFSLRWKLPSRRRNFRPWKHSSSRSRRQREPGLTSQRPVRPWPVLRKAPMHQRSDGVWVFSRTEFCCERWAYRTGQHVTFAGPTQNGKTKLAFQLLEYTATPEVPAYVAVSKPRDPVTSEEGKRLGYRRHNMYPFPPKIKEMFKEGKPAGYLMWPDMDNPETAMVNASRETRSLITGVYADGAKGKKCILVLDDTVTKSKVLNLDKDMVMVLTMSGAMGVGGWFFVQKPTGAGNTALWSFSQSDHLFIARDPDKRNRERYTEIGGFDTKEVERICQTLKRFQFLYLEREHRYMCIIDAD